MHAGTNGPHTVSFCKYMQCLSLNMYHVILVVLHYFKTTRHSGYLMNPSLSTPGYGGGEATAWPTHCCGARMGSWLYFADPAPPYSCYVSGLVFL